MIKMSIYQDIKILNLNASGNGAEKCMKQNLIQLKGFISKIRKQFEPNKNKNKTQKSWYKAKEVLTGTSIALKSYIGKFKDLK